MKRCEHNIVFGGLGRCVKCRNSEADDAALIDKGPPNKDMGRCYRHGAALDTLGLCPQCTQESRARLSQARARAGSTGTGQCYQHATALDETGNCPRCAEDLKSAVRNAASIASRNLQVKPAQDAEALAGSEYTVCIKGTRVDGDELPCFCSKCKPAPNHKATPSEQKTGGSVDYYKCHVSDPISGGDAYTAESIDIIEALGMTFAEGEAFKAIWRTCTARMGGAVKADNPALYNAEKVEFYGARMVRAAKRKATS